MIRDSHHIGAREFPDIMTVTFFSQSSAAYERIQCRIRVMFAGASDC
jgi:hypothetical protein